MHRNAVLMPKEDFIFIISSKAKTQWQILPPVHREGPPKTAVENGVVQPGITNSHTGTTVFTMHLRTAQTGISKMVNLENLTSGQQNAVLSNSFTFYIRLIFHLC